MARIYRYYNCEILHVVDGDTVDIMVDLGLSTYVKQRFRLYGIDAPEMKGESRALGLESKMRLFDLLRYQERWTIETFKDSTDKYGRYLCNILYDEKEGSETVNQQMVLNGHAINRVW